MKFTKWLRTKLSGKMKPTSPRKKTSFLDLPGELHNKIYGYALFPVILNEIVTVSNATKPHQMAATMLVSPLFRLSHQIRIEAFSYFCANMTFNFLGIDTASIFFACAGEAVKEVKVVMVKQSIAGLPDSGEGREALERFFGFVERMEGLKMVRVEGFGKYDVVGEGRVFRQFLNRMEGLEERGVEVQMRFGGGRGLGRVGG